jgi:hypothetical protein
MSNICTQWNGHSISLSFSWKQSGLINVSRILNKFQYQDIHVYSRIINSLNSLFNILEHSSIKSQYFTFHDTIYLHENSFIDHNTTKWYHIHKICFKTNIEIKCLSQLKLYIPNAIISNF